jgi:hypothetical protein
MKSAAAPRSARPEAARRYRRRLPGAGASDSDADRYGERGAGVEVESVMMERSWHMAVAAVETKRSAF